MKKLLSMFLACVLLLGILPTSAWAADSVEAALGEVDIYNGGYELGYLSINGAVKKQDYCVHFVPPCDLIWLSAFSSLPVQSPG